MAIANLLCQHETSDELYFIWFCSVFLLLNHAMGVADQHSSDVRRVAYFEPDNITWFGSCSSIFVGGGKGATANCVLCRIYDEYMSHIRSGKTYPGPLQSGCLCPYSYGAVSESKRISD